MNHGTLRAMREMFDAEREQTRVEMTVVLSLLPVVKEAHNRAIDHTARLERLREAILTFDPKQEITPVYMRSLQNLVMCNTTELTRLLETMPTLETDHNTDPVEVGE